MTGEESDPERPRAAAGDLTVRSISTSFTYALARTDRGFDVVLAEVGGALSGEACDELSP